MCNFGPVWGFLAAYLAAIGGAVSSAYFAGFWVKTPLAYIAAIGFTAAAVWAGVAVALGRGPLLGALNTYCTCTSAIARCASLCTAFRAALTVLDIALSIVGIFSIVMAIWPAPAAYGVLLAMVLAISLASIALLVIAGMLASCQPAAAPPMPPITPPAPGPGTAPAPTPGG